MTVLGYKKERIVVKFGGKALAEGERVKQLVEKISLEIKSGKQVAVVVSAVGDTTDLLIEYSSKACNGKISPKDLDEILAMGERTSARLFTAALKAHGMNAKFLDPLDGDWPIITDDSFGNAHPLLDESISRIRSKLEPLFNGNSVPVIPGFIGKTSNAEITTLGRGGSDTTAFLIAKAVSATEVVLVTDVEGIMTADPKIIPDASTIGEVNVEELVNLCDFSNKFIHRKALKFLDGSFRVKILSYKGEKLNEGGTTIQGSISKDAPAEKTLACLTLVAVDSLDVWKTVPKVLEVATRNSIPVLLFSADADSIALYVHEQDAEKAVKILHSKLISRGENKFLALAVKRGIAWTKVSGLEIEALKGSWEKLFGVLTIASNTHLLMKR